MTAQHPSRTWRGCACCKPHKRRGQGQSHRQPISVLRRVGKTRRVKRKELP